MDVEEARRRAGQVDVRKALDSSSSSSSRLDNTPDEGREPGIAAHGQLPPLAV